MTLAGQLGLNSNSDAGQTLFIGCTAAFQKPYSAHRLTFIVNGDPAALLPLAMSPGSCASKNAGSLGTVLPGQRGYAFRELNGTEKRRQVSDEKPVGFLPCGGHQAQANWRRCPYDAVVMSISLLASWQRRRFRRKKGVKLPPKKGAISPLKTFTFLPLCSRSSSGTVERSQKGEPVKAVKVRLLVRGTQSREPARRTRAGREEHANRLDQARAEAGGNRKQK